MMVRLFSGCIGVLKRRPCYFVSGRPISAQIFRSFATRGSLNSSKRNQDDTSSEAKDLQLQSWDRGGRTSQNSLTPLYSSMKNLIEANPGCVCLIQVGSFYELYFEQAEEFGPRLGLKVATRKTSNHSIPMAGFPVHQLQKFVKILVQDCGTSIAIIDQFNLLQKTSDLLIHRKISRIVSPGTLVDESFLNYNQNNFLVTIALPANCTKYPPNPDDEVGLSWIDLSVGEFYVQQTTLKDLIADLSRISPSEVLISKEFMDDDLSSGAWYPPLNELRKYFIRYHKTNYSNTKLHFKASPQEVRKKLEDFTQKETMAIHMAISYIKVNLPESDPVLDVPVRYWNQKYLQMDSRTREALELTERSTGGRSSTIGSFLSTIRRTVTPSGTRLLTQWIKSPIVDTEELVRRQDFVEVFKENNSLTTTVRFQLGRVGDFIRLLQRLIFNTGDMLYNLQAVSEGLSRLQELKQILENEAKSSKSSAKILGPFLAEFDIPGQIVTKITNTLNWEDIDGTNDSGFSETILEDIGEDSEEDISNTSNSYSNKSIEKYREKNDKLEARLLFSVRKDYNSSLKQAHERLSHHLACESTILSQIKQQTGAIDPKLNVIKKQQHGRFNNVILISGKIKLIDQVVKAFADSICDQKKTSVLVRSVDWNTIQSSIEQEVEYIRHLENGILQELRQEVLQNVLNIRAISRLVDYLDVTSSFAVLAEDSNLARPKFMKAPVLKVSEGRHIVVESGLRSASEMFTPNDTMIGVNDTLWVITGPNMGGKSTYLRQNALIVILAQIGSFVPASKASLGIVDRIFTRIGASDDLFSDLSTFMVEMVETSNILNSATSRSLAIVDEVGRGTSGKEGLAIAYATLLALLTKNKCRTLFATHFGKELYNLMKEENIKLNQIRFFRTKVVNRKDVNGDKIIIDHALEEGISDRSFALEVAQAAGFPKSALADAQRALNIIDKKSW